MERVLRVTVPQQGFVEQVERHLLKLSRTLNIKGFRRGKVPVRVVRQYHLPEVYEEVVKELVQVSLQEALVSENVSPAVPPEIEIETYGEDRPLKYRALFDVYPVLCRSDGRPDAADGP